MRIAYAHMAWHMRACEIRDKCTQKYCANTHVWAELELDFSGPIKVRANSHERTSLFLDSLRNQYGIYVMSLDKFENST